MILIGSIVNGGAIFLGAMGGIILQHGISKRFNDIIMKAIGLSVILIGLLSAFEVTNVMLLIISMVGGAIVGEALQIEEGLEKWGKKVEKRFEGSNFAEGFVTATLLYCVGSMAIIGAIKSGLSGDHETLFAKSVIDGITSVILASSLGIGVAFSAVSVLLYQGTITLSAGLLNQVVSEVMISNISAVGGLLIASIGINMIFGPKIKTGNLLPAVLGPILYYGVLYFL